MLAQTCFLMDILPASRDPGQLAAARRPVAGAVGGTELLIGAFRTLRGELKDEMRAGEDRTNKRINEVKEEMKEFKLDGSAAVRVLQPIAVLARITQ